MKSNRRRRQRQHEHKPTTRHIVLAVLGTLIVIAAGSLAIALSMLWGRVDLLTADTQADPDILKLHQEQYVRVLDPERGEDTKEIALAETMIKNQRLQSPAHYLINPKVQHSLLRLADSKNPHGSTFRDQFFLLSYFDELKLINLMPLPNTLFLKGEELAADQLQAYVNYAGIQYVRDTLEAQLGVHIDSILEFEISELLNRFQDDERALNLALTKREAEAVNVLLKDRLLDVDGNPQAEIPPLVEVEGLQALMPQQALAYWRLGEIEGALSIPERRSYLLDSLIYDYMDLGFEDWGASLESLRSIGNSLSTDLNFWQFLRVLTQIEDTDNLVFRHYELMGEDEVVEYNRYGMTLTVWYPRIAQQRLRHYISDMTS